MNCSPYNLLLMAAHMAGCPTSSGSSQLAVVGRLAQMWLCRWFMSSWGVRVRDTNLKGACLGKGQPILANYVVALLTWLSLLVLNVMSVLLIRNRLLRKGKKSSTAQGGCLSFLSCPLLRREGFLSHPGFLLVILRWDLYSYGYLLSASPAGSVLLQTLELV